MSKKMTQFLILLTVGSFIGCSAERSDDGQPTGDVVRVNETPVVRQEEVQHAKPKSDGVQANDTPAARKTVVVVAPAGRDPRSPGKAIKILNERPPESEDEYRSKYAERPTVIFVPNEQRWYSYIQGCRTFWNQRTGVWNPGNPEE